MSKRQRGTRRPSANLYRPATDDAADQNEPGTTSTSGPAGVETTRVTGTRTSGGSAVTSRSARRRARTQVAARPKSPLERYRGLLLIGFAVLGVAIIGVVFFSSVSAAPYVCSSLLTPGPTDVLPTAGPSIAATPSPSPSPTAAPSPSGLPDASGSPAASASASPSVTPVPSPTLRLGFPTKDLGREHVANNSSVTYGFCPPTSGNHYADPQAPLPRQFYPPSQTLKPQNWVHNLEHGYVVILYKGTPDQATIDSIRTVMDTAAGDTFTTTQCSLPNRVLAVRFDDMNTSFAVVSWDRALLLPQWDPVQAKTFAEQWAESPAIPEPGTC